MVRLLCGALGCAGWHGRSGRPLLHFAAGAVRKTLRPPKAQADLLPAAVIGLGSRAPCGGPWQGRYGAPGKHTGPTLGGLQFQKRVATDGRALSVLGSAQAVAIAGPAPETRPRTTLPEQAARPLGAGQIVRGRIPDWTPRPVTEAKDI